MHQALYRKWRPAVFDDVCGQEHITPILKYEVANNKISHAYLFCGSRGTGKTTCAKILAKAVNCLNPQKGNPCCKCAACLDIESGAATDVLEMDAASNNGIDNIRDIRQEVVYTPASLKYRVYIVDEVHALSLNAFNALLKTLEEPPAHVIFILATTEMHKLPATIVSRCQRFDFKRIATKVIFDRLMQIASAEGILLPERSARIIARLSQGGMRDAISLLELCSSQGEEMTPELVSELLGVSGREEIFNLVSAIADKDYEKILLTIAEVALSSKDITVFWQEIIGFYRDMLVTKTVSGADAFLELSDNEEEQLKEVAGRFSLETIIYHSRLLDDSLYTIQRAAVSKRAVAELTLIRMCDSRLDETNAALLARISELEDQVALLSAGHYRQPPETKSQSSVPKAGIVTPIKEKNTSKGAASKESISKESKPKKGAAEKKPAEPISQGKKVLRALPYWAELIDKIGRTSKPTAGLLIGSRGYSTGESGNFLIRVSSPFAVDMLMRLSNFELIHSALCTFEKREISDAAVKIEQAPQKKEDNDTLVIDELIKNAAD
ncbi:MAG: DNA polymerase III subunit gamma/tau [Clostridiales bacterium]|nr:DNA polymerase III subunit gamma/tau [Clostridiales bacterium]